MTDVTVSAPSARPARTLLRLAGDDRLAQRAARGDRQAFAVIFERYHQPLYRYCRSILGNEEDAADALQNAMSKALQALGGERRDIALKPWLYRIAHNESVSLLRRRRPESDIDEAAGLVGAALETSAATRDELRQLLDDLRDLPERQRAALVMRELGGLSHAEVATVFGVSEPAAKQAVYEARTALHDLAEGRAMPCDDVRRALSDDDGRVLRSRRVRAHLRDCAGCRDFRSALKTRPAELAAIAPPLPALAAAGMLQGLLGGGGGGGTGGGLFGFVTGGTAKAAGGGSLLAKGAAISAATVAVGGGAASIGATVHDSADPRPPAVHAGESPGGSTSSIGERAGRSDGEPGSRQMGERSRDRRDGDARSAERGSRRPNDEPGSHPTGAAPGSRGRPPAAGGRSPGAAQPVPRGAPETTPRPGTDRGSDRIPQQGTSPPGSRAPAPPASAPAPAPEPPTAPDAGDAPSGGPSTPAPGLPRVEPSLPAR